LDRKLLEILKKDRTWLKYELHCNVKTPAPLFFQNNLTFVFQMLIDVIPRTSKYVNKLAIVFYFFIPEVKQYGRSWARQYAPECFDPPISFHPCVKLGPEQSWHHFKINKWPITNYVQTQFSVIFSNISMIIMYYEYMTTQYFVRFFLSI
jgi:hypothetical protein